jgi:hypothetical protein
MGVWLIKNPNKFLRRTNPPISLITMEIVTKSHGIERRELVNVVRQRLCGVFVGEIGLQVDIEPNGIVMNYLLRQWTCWESTPMMGM